jgi:hypothetical protein
MLWLLWLSLKLENDWKKEYFEKFLIPFLNLTYENNDKFLIPYLNLTYRNVENNDKFLIPYLNLWKYEKVRG